VKTLVKFGIIYAMDPLLQNKTKIVASVVDHVELRSPIYQIEVVFHTLYI